jgi:hypothetical protein
LRKICTLSLSLEGRLYERNAHNPKKEFEIVIEIGREKRE